MKITSLFKAAATAGVALTLSTMTAFAIEATATVELNVRTGPGTNFGVIDTLAYGEHVNTTECVSSGWCYIEQAQQNGWVSSSYLRAVPAPAPTPGTPPAGADCQLVLTFGSGRATLERVCTPVTPPPGTAPLPPPPVGAEACFYRKSNYQGVSFCYASGQLNSLNAQFNDRIRSVRLNGNIAVRLCVDNNMGGYCADITNNAPAFGALLDRRTSSLKVYTPGIVLPAPPPPPPASPVMFRTGALSIAPSFTADFDSGVIGGSGGDIWHHAITSLIRRIEVRNGARIAVGDGSNRGFSGCSAASYSTNPVPLSSLPVGTYVCLKTNHGRIAQFRVNSFTGATMNVGYTVWAN